MRRQIRIHLYGFLVTILLAIIIGLLTAYFQSSHQPHSIPTPPGPVLPQAVTDFYRIAQEFDVKTSTASVDFEKIQSDMNRLFVTVMAPPLLNTYQTLLRESIHSDWTSVFTHIRNISVLNFEVSNNICFVTFKQTLNNQPIFTGGDAIITDGLVAQYKIKNISQLDLDKTIKDCQVSTLNFEIIGKDTFALMPSKNTLLITHLNREYLATTLNIR